MRAWLMAIGLMASTAAAQVPGSYVAPGESPAGAAAPGRPVDAAGMATLMQQNGGSLMRASLLAAPEPDRAKMSTASFFYVPEPQPRTLKKHDLVTIIIREESEISSDASTELKKEMNVDAAVDEWVKLQLSNFALQGGAQGDNPPSVKFGANRDFKGEGSVDRTDSFLTRITAEVVDVKPNGTFVIQARKRIKHDEEEQEYVLTGNCRGSDVTPDNTVMSWQISDLQITTTHEGAIRDSTKRGLVPRLLDLLNPF